MAGTSDNFNGSNIILGPGRLYADVAVPSAGGRITLDTDNTPDSTANPNAKHLGMTAAGAKISLKQEIQEFESDEFTAPHATRIIKEPTMLKADLLQIKDLTNILKYVWPGGTYATASGYKEIAFGGLSAVTYYSYVLIAPLIDDSTKVLVLQLYKAFNAAGVEFDLTRKDQAKLPIELKGQAVTTRAVGDQIGKLWIQIA